MNHTFQAALFDMDHTLIDNDCDVSWKMFMQSLGLAPADAMETAERYYEEYLAGRLDEVEFMAWQLREIAGKPLAEARALARRHFETVVKSKIYPEALRSVQDLLDRGMPVAIVTSTNDLVARPVAEHFGIDTLLATTLEVKHDRITGAFVPPYMIGDTKVVLGKRQCDEWGVSPQVVAYFGDSPADLPLLRTVGFPHVVNPKPSVLEEAQNAGWPVLKFMIGQKSS